MGKSIENIQKLWELEVRGLHKRLKLATAREGELMATNEELKLLLGIQEQSGLNDLGENLLSLNPLGIHDKFPKFLPRGHTALQT
jgi:hypothetical protein